MDLQLNGKVALVTGSSKGIGEAIARTLAREHARVIIHGRNVEQATRIAADVKAQGGDAYAVAGDLTDDDQVKRMLDEAEAVAGAIDILVNNAGGSGGQKAGWATTQTAAWIATFDRNVLAAVRVTTRLLPRMRSARWGRVINISSLAASMPPPAGADYAAAKAAINAMTASMAKAVSGDGVTVNAVSPGTIHSATLEARFRDVAAERGLPHDAAWRDVEEAVLPSFAQVPVGRVGRLDDVAHLVAFLASPLAGYITGANLRVDGGLSSSV